MNKVFKSRFEDTEVAFGDKSDLDLKRMYFLFSMMNNAFLTWLGISMMRLSLWLRLPIVFLIRKTLFKQFCGGESLLDSDKTVQELGESNIYTILDYSVEGESDEETFENNKNEILNSITFAAEHQHIPIGVMKLSGFVRFNLLRKKQERVVLTEKDNTDWSAFVSRVDEICAYAVQKQKMLFIDAEETWIQDPIDEVVNSMMRKYNRDKVFIYNTYQMYRKVAFSKLMDIHSLAKDEGFKIGAKLVRGAYMEKERQRAEVMLYDDPIYASKYETDEAYDEALTYSMKHNESIALCIGTHNEDSSMLAIELMKNHGIDKANVNVVFAQLYGMSDNISYTLSAEGYNVAKYVPYGPVRKVIPYLMRRAEENTSISGQSSREFLLVKKEIIRRKKLSRI